jgi:hypothetical protein
MKFIFDSTNRPLESIGKLVPNKSMFQPNITVNLKEVYLRPFQNSADCFIHVILINSSQEASTTFQNYYKAFLTIDSKEYEGYLASLSGYCGYDRRYKGAKPTPLVSIKREISDSMLIPGKHKDGWLRFRFDNLPDWPEGETYFSGIHEELNEETNELEEIEEYSKPALTTSATSIKLVLKDSYDIVRRGIARLPCWEESRVIRKPGHVNASLD